MANQTDRATIDLVINGQQSQTTLREIATAAVNARRALSNMAETDPGYARQRTELEALMRAQQQRIVRINEEKTAWQKFMAGSGQITAGITAANAITAGIGLVKDGLRAAAEEYKHFNAASADMAANLGIDGKTVEYFNEQAKKVGPTMGKSAAEMLEAYKLVGSANSDLIKTPELLAQVTKEAVTLSQASKMTLEDATASLVGSMNQFDAGAAQAQRFINVMAGGAQVGSAEIGDMAMALKASGIVAHQAGLSFEQTNGALQSLSKESLKGEQAGTMLRNILLSLQTGADATNPKVVGLDVALDNLAKKNLSAAEMTKLFGKENITAALSLINHRDRVTEFTDGLSGTTAAYDMAAKNNETYEHKLEMFDSVLSKVALTIGEKVIPVVTDMLDGFMTATNWLDKQFLSASEAATQAFEDQRTTVQGLTKNIEPLLTRYDQLKGKTNLTKAEQAELKKIVDQVAGAIPTAITEFDNYGNAMAISTGKARDFVAMQKELLKYNNKKAIEETTNELGDLNDELKKNSETLRTMPRSDGSFFSAGLNGKEVQQLQARNREIQAQQKALELRKKGLTGDYLDTPAQAAKTTPVNTGSTLSAGSGETESKEEKKARLAREREAKATQKHKESLDDLISQANQRIAKDEGDSYQKDLLALDQHYKKMEALAKGNADKLKEIADLKDKELAAIEAKHQEKETKDALEAADKQAKRMDGLRKEAEAELEVQREVKNAQVDTQVADGSITKEQGDQIKLTNEAVFLDAKKLLYEAHYQSLLDLYKNFEDKRTEIEQTKKTDDLAIQKEIAKNDGDQAQAKKATADAVVAHDKQATAAQKQQAKELYEKKKEIFNDSVTVLKTFFKENTLVYKAAMIAQQAWALGEVAVNLSRAVMAGIASSAGIPFPANLLAIAKAVAVPTLAAASAVANIRAQKFDVPAFIDGGYNSDNTRTPSGYVSNPTYFSNRNFTAAENGKQEYIISNPMLQNPVIANLAGAMEAMRVTGSYKSLAYSNQPAGPAPAPASASGQSSGPDGWMVLAASIERLHKTVESQSGDRPVQNLIDLKRDEDRNEQIRNSTSLKRSGS